MTDRKQNEPMTAYERACDLLERTDAPTANEIAEAIQDAEFDTLKHAPVIAGRHGLRPTDTEE